MEQVAGTIPAIKKQTHIAMMIDLETLGLETDCAILSGAYVIVDLYAPEFKVIHQEEMKLNIENQSNRKVDTATVLWHVMNTSAETVKENFGGQKNLRAFLEQLYIDYIKYDVHTVWSKGADFDIAILDHAYKTYISTVPWHYRVRRCFRTTLEVAMEDTNIKKYLLDKPPFVTNHAKRHTAIADALNQMHQLWNIYNIQIFPYLPGVAAEFPAVPRGLDPAVPAPAIDPLVAKSGNG